MRHGRLGIRFRQISRAAPDYESRLLEIETFLDRCLPQYSSNGMRARLHYFKAIGYENNYQLDLAAAECERAVNHLIKRAERELAEPQSPKYETERSFIIYCLGKIELRLAQLDFARGRLTSAKRHAWEAGLLLRSSKDIYLPGVADLLTYEIRRYEPDFAKTGWELVKQVDRYATAANDHLPNRLHAKTEQIKTCVYLRHLKSDPPDEHPTFLTLEGAWSAIEDVIKQTNGPELRRVRFAAMLVKARALNRLGRWGEALATVKQVEALITPLPAALQAEAFFTRAKILSSRSRANSKGANWKRDCNEAYRWFSKAETVGHSSVTFRISCLLQKAEALLQLDQIVAAGEEVKAASHQLIGVEHSFLHERSARLETDLARVGSFFCRFGSSSDLESVQDRLGRAYLLALAQRTGVEIGDLLTQHSHLKSPGVSRTQLKTLLRHYQRRREKQSPAGEDGRVAAAGGLNEEDR